MIDMPEDDIRIILNILLKHVPDCEFWAFGSRVTGSAHSFSDFDIALKCRDIIPIDVFAQIKEELSASPLPYRVDLLDWNRTSEEFRSIIDRQKVLLNSLVL